MAETARRTVNLKDAARELGVSIPTIYRAAHADELPVPVIRLGNRMVVSRSALDAVLAERKEIDPNGFTPAPETD